MIQLRSAAFLLWFYGLTTVLAVAGIGLRGAAPHVVRRYARWWTRLVLAGLRRCCALSWEVSGLEHLPAQGPALIASMHQSAFDTLVWPSLCPDFTYVVKRELMRIPLFGPLLRRAGMIGVDRRGGAAAMRRMLREAEAAVAEERQIIIFPEGTRVSPGVRVPLQPGIAALAERTRLPVLPVVTDSGRYWGRRAFRKFPGVIRVVILPPIPPGLTRSALLARLEADFREGAAKLDKAVENFVGD